MNAEPESMYDEDLDADHVVKDAGDKKPEESDEPTALIPKSLVPGEEPEIGSEIVLVVKAIHESEIEVGYAPKKSEKEPEPATDPMYD